MQPQLKAIGLPIGISIVALSWACSPFDFLSGTDGSRDDEQKIEELRARLQQDLQLWQQRRWA